MVSGVFEKKACKKKHTSSFLPNYFLSAYNDLGLPGLFS
jgi:hypothetical protein